MQRVVALTFDDGPDPDATPRVLDVLRERGVRATFFLVGERAEAHAAVARRIVDDGHDVGNHSHRHAWFTNFLAAGPLRREYRRAADAIEQAAGRRPVTLRPPVGLTNPLYRKLGGALGVTIVGWDARGLDRSPLLSNDADNVVDRVMGRVRAGSVILLHDAGGDADLTVRTVTQLLDALAASGIRVVPLAELIGENQQTS